MNRIRYLAASLLCLTGIIHIARLGMVDAPVAIVEAFGLAYLTIGVLLFRNNKIARYLGAIVPLLGLCSGPFILKNPSIQFIAFLGAIEIAIVCSCFSLINKSRSANTASK